MLMKEGQKFHKGDIIMKFNLDMIQKAGKSTETILAVTNADEQAVTLEQTGKVSALVSFMNIGALSS